MTCEIPVNAGVRSPSRHNFLCSQELLLNIKKALGAGCKVTSIAVVAPGNTPGCIALLDGCSTRLVESAATLFRVEH